MATRSRGTQIHRRHPKQGSGPRTPQSPTSDMYDDRANLATDDLAERYIATDGPCDDPYFWVYPYGYLY